MPLLAFLVAPPVGAIAYVAWIGGASEITTGFTVWAIIFSLIFGFFFGFPFYWFLKSKGFLNLITLSIGGAVIAMLPWAILSNPDGTVKSVADGVTIIENGAYTAEGLIFQAKFVAQFGVCGAISGAIFWLMIKSLITSHSSRRSKLRG
jgi:hypothetical protein